MNRRGFLHGMAGMAGILSAGVAPIVTLFPDCIHYDGYCFRMRGNSINYSDDDHCEWTVKATFDMTAPRLPKL